MGKSIAIQQKTLGVILLVALLLLYLNFWGLGSIGQITILVVALLLILK
ncbi:MAG: hypothetical protein Q8R18_00890 [bacterium]|nr:hypothetical protein [bacterium]